MGKRAFISLFAMFSFIPTLGQQPEPPSVPSPRRRVPPPPPPQPTPDADDVVRITTNLVQIDTVVTKDNKQVTDLKAEDFEILDEGKVQPIINFSFVAIPPKPFSIPTTSSNSNTTEKIPVAPPPVRMDEPHRTIALVVDDLGVSMESTGVVRKQLRKFVNEEVQANDLIAIVRTGSEVGALQQFTNDKQMLLRAIDAVKWNHCSRAGISIFAPSANPSMNPSAALNTNGVGICSDPSRPLHGSIQALRFILQGMRQLPGRKSMVVFSENMPVDYYEDYLPTSGISTSSPRGSSSRQSEAYDLQRLSELAVRSSVVSYCVD